MDMSPVSRVRTRTASTWRERRGIVFRGYWWEDPARLTLFFILPLYLLIASTLFGNPKGISRIYFNVSYGLAGAVFLLVVAAAAGAGRGADPKPALSPVGVRLWVLDALFWLSLLGYAVMMSNLIVNPSLLVGYLTGEVTAYDLILSKVRVTGISTFTQAAVAYVPLHFYTFRRRGKPIDRYTVYLAVLYLLVTIRAFLFSERLALIEMALPAAFMYLRFRRVQRYSTLLWLGPFAAVGLLILLFLVNEYPRSWESFYIHVYDNYFDFAVDRLGLYYSTALNNGAGLLSVLGWGGGDPIFTLDWLIHFPVLGELLQIYPGSDDLYQRFMDGWADPEFNSPSGIFVHFYEFGWFALLVAAFIGWVFRLSYRGWRTGSGFWCCAHGVLMVSLFELIRIPFLFSGRNLVPIALLALAFSLLRQPDVQRAVKSRGASSPVSTTTRRGRL